MQYRLVIQTRVLPVTICFVPLTCSYVSAQGNSASSFQMKFELWRYS